MSIGYKTWTSANTSWDHHDEDDRLYKTVETLERRIEYLEYLVRELRFELVELKTEPISIVDAYNEQVGKREGDRDV